MITHDNKNNNGSISQEISYILAEFRKQYPIESGWSIETNCISHDNKRAVFKAAIKNPGGNILSTGHAEAPTFEQGETKAIGKALTVAGFITMSTKPKQSEKPDMQDSQAELVQISSTTSNGQRKKTGRSSPPDEQKAEKWARENLEEWLDTKCPFSKAAGRTWRELAKNEGDKIEVNGRLSVPRAYLHSIESWKECKVWSKIKAKVALDKIKNGTSVNHYNRPEEVGG